MQLVSSGENKIALRDIDMILALDGADKDLDLEFPVDLRDLEADERALRVQPELDELDLPPEEESEGGE